MARSSDASNVPEGTTLVFGSWACTTDGLGGLSSHLVTPKLPVSKTSNQTVGISNSAELGGNQALLSSNRTLLRTRRLQLEFMSQSSPTQTLILKNLNFPKVSENTGLSSSQLNALRLLTQNYSTE